MKLSIIIVSYNVKHFVEQCLRSVFASRGIARDEMEVFVVDNQSKDGSVDYLKQRFPYAQYPNLHILANKRNVGFGRANNQATRRARGKYVLFLNPDTLLPEGALAATLAEAERHPDLGALGARMRHTTGTFALESRRGLPSPWVSFCKMAGLCALFPKSHLFGRYYMRYLPLDAPTEIDIVSGAYMLVPAEALRETGGFDETFFMYGEDIDLSYRLKKSGRHNRYAPIDLLHYKGESTKKGSYRYVHVFYEAMLNFFQKHYKHYNLLLSLPIKLAIILRALIALIAGQLRFLRRFLHPRGRNKPLRFLYLGHAADSVKQIAEEYGLDIDYLSADERRLPEGHHSEGVKAECYCTIVYDLADYSVERVLRNFTDHPLKNVHIGTFNPQTGVIVTACKTYV